MAPEKLSDIKTWLGVSMIKEQDNGVKINACIPSYLTPPPLSLTSPPLALPPSYHSLTLSLSLPKYPYHLLLTSFPSSVCYLTSPPLFSSLLPLSHPLPPTSYLSLSSPLDLLSILGLFSHFFALDTLCKRYRNITFIHYGWIPNVFTVCLEERRGEERQNGEFTKIQNYKSNATQLWISSISAPVSCYLELCQKQLETSPTSVTCSYHHVTKHMVGMCRMLPGYIIALH